MTAALATSTAPTQGMHLRLIRLPQVMEMTGLSRPTIYKAMIANRFPASVKFGSATMWVVHEIERWIQERITQSRC